jgi:hypothetical protein
MSIGIITDSLGLPRPQSEEGASEFVWPLQMKNVQFIHSRAGYTICDVNRDIELNLLTAVPDTIFLQIGIVDCAPRVLSKLEARIIRRIPVLSRLVGWVIKKYRPSIIRLRKLQYVPIDKFRSGLKDLKSAFSGSRIVAISILPACGEYEEILPGISQQIKAYNAALAEHFEFLDPYKGHDVRDLCLSDFHHLNEKGHKVVLSAVTEFVAQ